MALLLFFFFLLASATTSTTADLTIPAIYKTCTNQTLQDPTTVITLDTLFTTLVAASNLTNFFQTNITTTATTVNGFYQCLADLSQSTDCKTCVRKLSNIIQKPCNTATAQLAGCYMMYEVVGSYISYSGMYFLKMNAWQLSTLRNTTYCVLWKVIWLLCFQNKNT